MDVNNADYIAFFFFFLQIPTPAKSLLNSSEPAAASIGLHVNADKMEFTCINQEGAIFTLNGGPLKLVDNFTYLSSRVSSTESDVNIKLTNAWTAIDWLPIIWKSDLSDKIKRDFFQAVVVSLLLYGR